MLAALVARLAFVAEEPRSVVRSSAALVAGLSLVAELARRLRRQEGGGNPYRNGEGNDDSGY